MSVRILIVDDHEIVRHGVRSILTDRPGWEVIGEAANGQEAIKAVSELQPDVVVLDITMPVLSGLEAASRIRATGFQRPILIFTMHESDSLAAEVREVGAQGYVQKSHAARDLVRAIEELLGGGTFFKEIDQSASPVQKNEPNSGGSFFSALSATFCLS